MKTTEILIKLNVALILLAMLAGCEQQEGCTSPNAVNYDPLAEVNDGSCFFETATPSDNSDSDEQGQEDECEINCQNGGTETANCTCNCPDGYSGLYCQTEETSQPQTQTISVNPPDQYGLCPTWYNGDQDFGGLVQVEASVSIYIQNQTELWREVQFDLEEPNPDYSAASGTWVSKIYEAPTGWKIKSINSGTGVSWDYLDTDWSVDINNISVSSSPVSSFAAKGDTNGDDIGNCTTDDAYLSVYYNTIQIEIEEL